MSEDGHGRAVAFISQHCDIVDRMNEVPPSALLRGLYFTSIVAVLRQLGRTSAFETYFPGERRSSLTFYPVRDYLLRLAVAGAVVASPARLHDGILEITRKNAAAFTTSLIGRVLLRILDRDPVRLTEQGLAARRQSTTYGEWELVRRADREIEMIYRGEYMWIESAISGAAIGTFEGCQIKPRLETILRDKYNGSTLVRW